LSWEFYKENKNLHPLFQIENSFVDNIDQNNNLDIFEMVANINELAKKIFNQELLIFQRYQVIAKDMKCLLEWWRKHESMFLTVGFLTNQILGIINFQIETERIFSFIDIFSNLKRWH
jgi:hypothetical protein